MKLVHLLLKRLNISRDLLQYIILLRLIFIDYHFLILCGLLLTQPEDLMLQLRDQPHLLEPIRHPIIKDLEVLLAEPVRVLHVAVVVKLLVQELLLLDAALLIRFLVLRLSFGGVFVRHMLTLVLLILLLRNDSERYASWFYRLGLGFAGGRLWIMVVVRKAIYLLNGLIKLVVDLELRFELLHCCSVELWNFL